MPRTIPANPRPRTLQFMEAVREHAPAAQSMRQLAKTLGISAVYLYDLIAWMPDGADYLEMVRENKRRAFCKDVHPLMEELYRLRNYEKGENRIPLDAADELARYYGLRLELVAL